MRCQECDYELWHCTGRTCPECGADFSLSDFIFIEENVLFHCPQCDYGIEGQKSTGIPPESIQPCESCGLAVGPNLFIVRPVGDCTSETFGSVLPIRQTSGNWIARYFKTVWLILTKPQIAISRVPVQEPLWDAWKFFLTTLVITIVVGLIPAGLFFALVNIGATRSTFGFFEFLILLLSQLIFSFISICLYIFLWSMVTHLLLQISGGSTFTLRRTMQSILYGGAATIVGIVPCVGGITSFVWWLVSTTNMITRGQRVHGGRASFATLSGPLFIITCVCGGYLVLVFSILQPALTQARSIAQQVQQQQQNSQVMPDDSATDQQSE